MNNMSDGKVPSTFGEKLVFGIPAIIVSLVLAVGLAFAIVSWFDQETRKHVQTVKAELETQTNALKEELASEKTKTAALQQQVVSLEAKSVKLAETTTTLATELKAVASGTEKVATDLTSFKRTSPRPARWSIPWTSASTTSKTRSRRSTISPKMSPA
jgi:nitrogen fixation/metabolism regulation signal transduction histidine kinase